MRIRQQIVDLAANRVDVRFVLGIDLGGTSREVVEEMLAWNVDVRIVKNRLPGHTFHPKLYLFEWRHQGMIIIGSNNITEGGFFANYEGAARVTYALPDELTHYESACLGLARFLDPQAPISHRLTPDLLASLIARGDLPTEDEARQGRDIARRARMPRRNRQRREPIFGVEAIDPPPPLPAVVLERLVAAVRDRQAKARKDKTAAARERAPQPPLDEKASSALTASAFYMTLPTLQGMSIPGEARIPLMAIELAKEFWAA